MKRRLAWLILSILLISTMIPIPSFAQTAAPAVSADSAILIDAATGEVLFEKQIEKQKYPASTTKVMTALLTLENLDLDQIVTIDAETPFTNGSRIYLLEGEQVTVEQLLYALLLESANDAAVALAKEISGSVSEFAVLMNTRALELGAKNTHFSNPNGLPDETHVTSSYDLAMIAKECMKNETFRKIVTTYQYTLPATSKQETRYLYNGNRMLYDQQHKISYGGVLRPIKYEGVTGIKTGYTVAAKSCFIGAAKRGETELIVVLLQAEPSDMYLDAIKLLEYGFDNYHTVSKFLVGDAVGEAEIKGGKEKTVAVMAGVDVKATLPTEASGEILETKVVLDDDLQAPLNKGQKAGVIEVYDGDKLVGTFDAVASETVEKSILQSSFSNILPILRYAGLGMLILIIILIILLGIFLLRHKVQIERRRKRRQKRKNAVQQISRVDVDRREDRRL